MAFRTDLDTGTPIRVANEQVTLTIDGRDVALTTLSDEEVNLLLPELTA